MAFSNENSECIEKNFRSEKKLKNLLKGNGNICTVAPDCCDFFYSGFRLNFLIQESDRSLNLRTRISHSFKHIFFENLLFLDLTRHHRLNSEL